MAAVCSSHPPFTRTNSDRAHSPSRPPFPPTPNPLPLLPFCSSKASDPSSFYPSFQLESLRQPYQPAKLSRPDSKSSSDENSSFSMEGDDDPYAPPPSPARLEAGRGARRGNGSSGSLGGLPDGDVPDTPLRRPGSGARLWRGGGGGGTPDSCSPLGHERCGACFSLFLFVFLLVYLFLLLSSLFLRPGLCVFNMMWSCSCTRCMMFFVSFVAGHECFFVPAGCMICC